MSDTSVMAPWAKALLAALATLTAALIGILTSFTVVHWKAPQTAVVVAEFTAFWAFIAALVAHFFPQTKQQPVAVAGTFTALVTASVAVGIAFSWWSVTPQQNAYITSFVTALIAVGSALVARTQVYAKPISPPPPPPGGAVESSVGQGTQAAQVQAAQAAAQDAQAAAAQALQAAQAIVDGYGKSVTNGHHPKAIKTTGNGHK